jgi:hypothetical protein
MGRMSRTPGPIRRRADMRQPVALWERVGLATEPAFPTLLLLCSSPFPLASPFLFPGSPHPFSSFSLPSSTMTSFQDPDAGSSSHMMKTTKRGRPFLKVCISSLLALPSYLTRRLPPGHSRSLCHSHRISPPHSPQAVFPQFCPLIHDVCPLFSDILSPLQFSFSATRPRKISLLSSFPSQIAAQIPENHHE